MSALDPKLFTRRAEDFLCGHCRAAVRGSGYTNHCPRCLWSRHVDIHPGDRAAECGALMEPIALQRGRQGQRILHRCLGCGYEKPNRSQPEDDFEALLALARRSASSATHSSCAS